MGYGRPEMDLKLILENQLVLLVVAQESLPYNALSRQMLCEAIDKTVQRLRSWGEGARR